MANSLAAIAHGAVQAQGTINGIGERCGNVDLTTVAANLGIKLGYDVLAPGGLQKLTEISRYVYEVANLVPADGQPYVGSAAFAHKGGMHVNAVRKDPVTFEHVRPETVGNERLIQFSDQAGRSTILHKYSPSTPA